MNQYITLTNDFMFRKFFGSAEYSEILRHFCEDILSRDIASVTVLNPYDIGEFRHKNQASYVIVDILARTPKGETFTIEMQNLPEKFYLERCRYYVMGAYRKNFGDPQLMRSDSKYSSLRPTYGIYVQNFGFYPDRYALEVWELYRRRTANPVKDDLEVALDEMYFFDLSGQAEDSLHKYWQEVFKEGIVSPQAPDYLQETVQAIDKNNLSGEEQMIMAHYEDLLVRERERIAYAEEVAAKRAAKEAAKKASAEGLREGLKEGAEREREEVALKMLHDHLDLNLIIKYSSLSKEKIQTLAQNHDLTIND